MTSFVRFVLVRSLLKLINVQFEIVIVLSTLAILRAVCHVSLVIVVLSVCRLIWIYLCGRTCSSTTRDTSAIIFHIYFFKVIIQILIDGVLGFWGFGVLGYVCMGI